MGWFDIFALVALVFVSVFGTAITLYTSWYKRRAKSFWAWCKQRITIYWEFARKNPASFGISALFVILFLLFVVLFFWKLNPLINSLYGIIDRDIEYIDLGSKAFRNASLSVAGSITLFIALLGVILTVIRSILTRQQNNTDEQRLIIEHIGQAITQIGAFNGDKPNIAIRLGGLYSLQGIMQTSSYDEATIAKIFHSYVCENARKDEKDEIKQPEEDGDTKKYSPPPREDVQAALNIIKQFDEKWKEQGKKVLPNKRLNFSHANFSGYSFERMDLNRSFFKNSDLSSANLVSAKLSGADLTDANLIKAILVYTKLPEAILINANLSNSIILSADLSKANLTGANLSQAVILTSDLSNANLRDTDLSDANLVSVNLANVKNLTQEQVDKARGNGKTKLPEGLIRPEDWDEEEEDDEDK